MNLAVAAAVMIFSCSVTLNPDGSGKAVVEVRQSADQPAAGAKTVPASEISPAEVVQEMFKHAAGVEAWSDLSVGASPDGLMMFKGTAYFSDIGQMQIHLKQAGTLPVRWAKDPKGGMVLKLDLDEVLQPSQPVQLTAEELAKRVEKAQVDWKQLRPSFEAESATIHFSYKLPGEPAEVTGFKKEADGAFHLRFDASKALAAIDQLMADATAVGNAILAGFEPSRISNPALQEKVLGARFPWRMAGEMKPQFDYAAEVKAAKEAQSAMLKKLGLDQPPGTAKPAPPEKPAAG